MNDTAKKMVSKAAIELIPDDAILGVGTGTTINFLIAMLPTIRDKIKATVASSEQTKNLLTQFGFIVTPFPQSLPLDLYIDGTDVYNLEKQLIKGRGGALTQEKILAYASPKFICLAEIQKESNLLDNVALPIEVLPMARSFVAREVVKLKGRPVLRPDYQTDNGNQIIDVYDLSIQPAMQLETTLNNIPGVIANGLFAKRPADIILSAADSNVIKIA